MINKPHVFYKTEDIPQGIDIIDSYDMALEELFVVENPKFKDKGPEFNQNLQSFKSEKSINPIWVFYEWENKIVKTVPEPIYLQLRTARNKNIITEKEQQNYRDFKIGLTGLSVGSTVLSALVITGGPKKIKIADPDIIEITNLNRIRANLLDVGQNKTHVAAREAWKLDPFLDLELWEHGISLDNLENFLAGIDVFIDEIDNIEFKIKTRILCRAKGIPVIMGTDNGETVILDIERFDLEPKRPIFHGLLGELESSDFRSLGFAEWVKIASKIVGEDYLEARMKSSLMELGKTIASVPQLGTTASMAGVAVANTIRELSNKVELESGRYTFGSKKEKKI